MTRRHKSFIFVVAVFISLSAVTLALANWDFGSRSRIEDMLIYAPNPLLRQIARPIDKHDTETVELLKDMADYLDDGIIPRGGLALPQLGVSKRGFVIMVDDYPVIMINPKLSVNGEKVASLEGCVSIPDTFGYVLRSEYTVVEYYDEDWQPQSLSLNDIEAFAAQHEHDHLEGILITDNFLPNKYNDPERTGPLLD